MSWTEDARLADGRMIVVKRTQQFERVMDVGAGFDRGWLFKKSWISAKLPPPANREVRWEGTLVPMLIDLLPSGQPILVGLAQTGRAGTEWSLGYYELYVTFVLDESWKRVSINEVPVTMHANLLGATHSLFIEEGAWSGIHVDLAKKREINSDERLVPGVKDLKR